jgi:hypothetical protein
MNLSRSGLRKFSFVIVVFLAMIGFTRPVMASGDDGCYAIWRLMHHDYEGCSNMAFLSPSNDTRVNLLLLMADLRSAAARTALKESTKARPDAPLFAWEALAERLGSEADKATLRSDGVGAQSGSATSPARPPSVDPFIAAVRADSALKPAERDALVAARDGKHPPDPAVTRAASAKAYALYLEGAAEFWNGDYDKAAATFGSLTNAQSAWVRETASYMVGRVLINRAQVGAFDEYGSFNKNWHADAATVAAAESALDKYLKQYPKGIYAQSARGLKRRGYWLAQDTARLESEFGDLMLLAPEERNASDVELAQEIDNKIVTPPYSSANQRDEASETALLRSTQNPLMLAMLDLLAMRTEETGLPYNESKPTNPMSLAALLQQKPYFASQMALYEFLLAVHAFYIENKPAEVLRIIPDAARQASFSYLQFSRQVLRGMALEALKDHNALGFWMQMLPGTNAPYQRPALELAIAYHEERAGEVRNVFAPVSPVRYPYLREVLLANVADAGLLRAQATNTSAPQRERDIALFTLLYKEATRGNAADFLKDLALVPSKAPTDGWFMLDGQEDSYFTSDDYHPPNIPLGIFLHDKTNASFGCPGLRVSEQQLAHDPGDPTARLCIADFVRLNPSLPPPSSIADQIGGAPSLFPGGDFARMDTYTAVLADPKASRNDKAYALFRTINCYAPAGNNACGGKDVPLSQRKAWFTTLKHEYANTRWANALEYYW